MDPRVKDFLVDAGICTSCKSQKAVNGKKHCQKCLDRIRVEGAQRREMLSRQGLCTRCGKAPAREGKKQCAECALKACANARKYAEEHPDYYRNLRRQLKDEGICPWCRGTVLDEHVYCPECRTKINSRYKKQEVHTCNV